MTEHGSSQQVPEAETTAFKLVVVSRAHAKQALDDFIATPAIFVETEKSSPNWSALKHVISHEGHKDFDSHAARPEELHLDAYTLGLAVFNRALRLQYGDVRGNASITHDSRKHLNRVKSGAWRDKNKHFDDSRDAFLHQQEEFSAVLKEMMTGLSSLQLKSFLRGIHDFNFMLQDAAKKRAESQMPIKK